MTWLHNLVNKSCILCQIWLQPISTVLQMFQITCNQLTLISKNPIDEFAQLFQNLFRKVTSRKYIYLTAHRKIISFDKDMAIQI